MASRRGVSGRTPASHTQRWDLFAWRAERFEGNCQISRALGDADLVPGDFERRPRPSLGLHMPPCAARGLDRVLRAAGGQDQRPLPAVGASHCDIDVQVLQVVRKTPPPPMGPLDKGNLNRSFSTPRPARRELDRCRETLLNLTPRWL